MDGFIAYMRKHRPGLFFFFDGFAAVCYIKRCDLVDMESGEVIRECKVGAASEAVYSRKYRRLFLKSLQNGCLYVYDFQSGKLEKLLKMGEFDRGIFLSHDEETVIAYTSYGITRAISVGTLEASLLTDKTAKYFYYCGFDNPNLGCYEMFGTNPDSPFTLLRLGYAGNLISEETIKIDGHEARYYEAAYCTEQGIYLALCDKIRADRSRRFPSEAFLSGSANPHGDTHPLLEEIYAGGCEFLSLYRHYAFLCLGTRNVFLVDLCAKSVLKKFEAGLINTAAAYDPKRNMLFIGSSKIHIFENVL